MNVPSEASKLDQKYTLVARDDVNEQDRKISAAAAKRRKLDAQVEIPHAPSSKSTPLSSKKKEPDNQVTNPQSSSLASTSERGSSAVGVTQKKKVPRMIRHLQTLSYAAVPENMLEEHSGRRKSRRLKRPAVPFVAGGELGTTTTTAKKKPKSKPSSSSKASKAVKKSKKKLTKFKRTDPNSCRIKPRAVYDDPGAPKGPSLLPEAEFKPQSNSVIPSTSSAAFKSYLSTNQEVKVQNVGPPKRCSSEAASRGGNEITPTSKPGMMVNPTSPCLQKEKISSMKLKLPRKDQSEKHTSTNKRSGSGSGSAELTPGNANGASCPTEPLCRFLPEYSVQAQPSHVTNFPPAALSTAESSATKMFRPRATSPIEENSADANNGQSGGDGQLGRLSSVDCAETNTTGVKKRVAAITPDSIALTASNTTYTFPALGGDRKEHALCKFIYSGQHNESSSCAVSSPGAEMAAASLLPFATPVSCVEEEITDQEMIDFLEDVLFTGGQQPPTFEPLYDYADVDMPSDDFLVPVYSLSEDSLLESIDMLTDDAIN